MGERLNGEDQARTESAVSHIFYKPVKILVGSLLNAAA